MTREEYFKLLTPWAKKAENKTGIPYHFILAQWGWETGYGGNRGAKSLNNHAGIKFVGSTVKGATKDGMYAKYPNMDLFVDDYARVMNLSYYKGVKSAKTDMELVQAINSSPWAENKYDVDTMLKNMKIALEIGEGIKIAPSKTDNKAVEGTKISFPDLNTLSSSEVNDFAKVGLALALVMTLIPKRNA